MCIRDSLYANNSVLVGFQPGTELWATFTGVVSWVRVDAHVAFHLQSSAPYINVVSKITSDVSLNLSLISATVATAMSGTAMNALALSENWRERNSSTKLVNPVARTVSTSLRAAPLDMIYAADGYLSADAGAKVGTLEDTLDGSARKIASMSVGRIEANWLFHPATNCGVIQCHLLISDAAGL